MKKPKKEFTIKERVDELEKTSKFYGILLHNFGQRIEAIEEELKKKN